MGQAAPGVQLMKDLEESEPHLMRHVTQLHDNCNRSHQVNFVENRVPALLRA